jgi:hypothetical protein
VYLLDEVAKEILKERLHEDEIERLLKQAAAQPDQQPNQLLARLGDFLVTNGQRLKGEYQPQPGKIVCRES